MVQQDQGQDKIQQEILQIKETYGTAGSGPGQNTAGEILQVKEETDGTVD
jgi:hypothetical protein